jgi:small subunit ribosomal protein S17
MRNSRKILSGLVVSDKMQKTITVAVDTYKKDHLYKKRVKKTNKFHVHDEKKVAKVGDLVHFMETRPISKTKKFRLFKIVNTKHKESKI